MRRPFAAALLLLITACSGPAPDDDDATGEGDDDDTVPTEEFTLGDEVTCANPTAGIDRFDRQEIDRGLDHVAPPEVPVEWRDCPPVFGGLVSTDIDADGDLDLLLHKPDGFPLIFVNDGAGSFTRDEVDLPTYDTHGRQTYGLGTADLDGDGLPEVTLVGPGLALLSRNLGGGNWSDYEVLFEEPAGDRRCIETLNWGDADGDGDLDLFLPGLETAIEDEEWYPSTEPVGNPNVLLLMEDGAVSHTMELIGAGGPSFSILSIFTDRDGDGDMDLLVSTDRPEWGNPPSAFYRNDGTDDDGLPILVDDAAAVGADIDVSGMGIGSNDINGDGDVDYILSDAGRLAALVSSPVGYIESSAALGLTLPDPQQWFGWSVELVDFDNNGALDLAATSGFEESFVIGENGPGQLIGADVLYEGDGSGGFTEVGAEVGFDSLDSHYGMVADDFDGDGHRDLVVAPLYDSELRFFSNPCGDGNWLEIELVGLADNREAFGARVEVVTSGRTDVQEVHSTRTYGQSATRIHVGLGSDAAAESLTVTWPGGAVSSMDEVPANRLVTVTHPDAG